LLRLAGSETRPSMGVATLYVDAFFSSCLESGDGGLRRGATGVRAIHRCREVTRLSRRLQNR
jgi:hypothetical protein